MVSVHTKVTVFVCLSFTFLAGCSGKEDIKAGNTGVPTDSVAQESSRARVDDLTPESARMLIENSPRHMKMDAMLSGDVSAFECGKSAGWWTTEVISSDALGKNELGKLTEKGKALLGRPQSMKVGQDYGYARPLNNKPSIIAITATKKLDSVFMRDASRAQVPVTGNLLKSGVAIVYYTWCWNELPAALKACKFSYKDGPCSTEKSPGVAQFIKSTQPGWILAM